MSWCPLVRIVRTKSGFKAVGHFFCQDCQDMRGKNDEKSRKSGYSGFPVSVVGDLMFMKLIGSFLVLYPGCCFVVC